MQVGEMAKFHVKKNDNVIVIAGKEKGKIGKILRVFPAEGRVVVEKVNLIKRHTRPSQQNPQGGIIEKEAPIHISNVLLYCTKCARGVRVGRRILEDGKKVRYCKKCGEVFDK